MAKKYLRQVGYIRFIEGRIPAGLESIVNSTTPYTWVIDRLSNESCILLQNRNLRLYFSLKEIYTPLHPRPDAFLMVICNDQWNAAELVEGLLKDDALF